MKMPKRIIRKCTYILYFGSNIKLCDFYFLLLYPCSGNLPSNKIGQIDYRPIEQLLHGCTMSDTCFFGYFIHGLCQCCH